MSLDEETFEAVARDGEMDYTKWPANIDALLERLEHITYHEFPIPRPYANINHLPDPISPVQDRPESTEQPTEQSKPDSSSPAATQAPATPIRTLPPVPLFPNSSATTTSHIPDSLPPSQSSPPPSIDTLPTPLLQLLQSILTTLRQTFPSNPPHTIQRLAELTLHPSHHYRTLPAWLRAVDRVVNVSSSADIFPLSEVPPLLANGVNGDSGGGILWKNDTNATSNGFDRDSLGSDESLGGALLTPIPWLRNAPSEEGKASRGDEDVEDDGLGEPIELGDEAKKNNNESGNGIAVTGNTDPLVPEREDGAVTQGELMRLEQEAGVVPVAVHRPSMNIEDGAEHGELGEPDETIPHARGPDVVGAVDMGRVGGKNMQVRIGSPPRVTEDKTRHLGLTDTPNVLGGSGAADSNEETVEGFEIVGKDDEMQIEDVVKAASSDTAEQGKERGKDSDEDIVLVDADGKMEDEN